MNYFVTEYQTFENTERTAGIKARDDLKYIFLDNGLEEIAIPANTENREEMNPFNKVKQHFVIAKKWSECLKNLKEGDSIVIQFPNIEHSIRLNKVFKKLEKKGVKIILIIHDIDLLRTAKKRKKLSAKFRMKLEEINSIRTASVIIAHNKRMAKYFERIVPEKTKVISLDIFDYLIKDYDESKFKKTPGGSDNPVVVAGNLRPHKAAYVYDLPEKLSVNMYGVDYEGKVTDNHVYHGSFEPDELPYVMDGSFGLVWDGDSCDTCSGIYGDYLKINNPHKTSLYLASNMPVAIWEKAALATFIKKNKCGITVASLDELADVLKSMDSKEYEEIKKGAAEVGKKLRAGYYTKKALDKCL